jgi:hypothetical protein
LPHPQWLSILTKELSIQLGHASGGQMTDYRIYQIGVIGRTLLVDVSQHDTDQAAIDAVSAAHPGKHLELWHGARLVCVLKRNRSPSD